MRLSHAQVVTKRAAAARNAIRRDNLRHRTLHHAAAALVALLGPEGWLRAEDVTPAQVRSWHADLRRWQAAVRRLRKAVAATERWLTMPEIVALAQVVLRAKGPKP